MGAQMNKYNSTVIDRLVEKYGYTKTFIRQSIAGERTSQMATLITKEYEELVLKVEKALK